MGIEASRHLEFHCPLAQDTLLARHLHGSERLGDCFEYSLTLYSLEPDLKAEDLLGQHATVRAQFGAQPPRYFDGIACEFAQTGSAGRYMTYRMVLRPWLWLLSRNRQCRVFQNQTTPEIARAIFAEWGFSDLEDQLMNEHPPRPYCVQYRESDLHFLKRLFEDEGIYFSFRHELGRHVLVLSDDNSTHDPVSGFETLHFHRVMKSEADVDKAAVYSWTSNKRVQAGKVGLRDYDYEKSRADMSAISSHPNKHAHADAELYDYPGDYEKVDDGQRRARLRLEQALSEYEVSEGTCDATGLCAGALFTLQDHPRPSENRSYLITAIAYEADSGSFESIGGSAARFSAQLRAIDSSVPFRPARTAHPPIIAGVQTATVVGPSGNEIWTDEYARVQIKFHWDRDERTDGSTSCWVRVAQGWTGNRFGNLQIPRIGQEVVVEFLEGNPDRPLITGCVYNDSNQPAYDVPAKKTESGIKTRSTPNGGKNDYNELRFDDAKGKEQLVLHAQRDMSVRVNNDRSTSIGHDHTHSVQNDLTLAVAKGNYQTSVEKGFMHVSVPSNEFQVESKTMLGRADQKLELTVGSSDVTLDQTAIKLAFGTVASITIDATGVTIAANGSQIVVSAAGVSINGAMVNINS